MALSNETEKWLAGLENEGKLPKEVIAQLRAAAESNKDSDNFIKGSVLRQDDYSRSIAEVKAAQKAVEESQNALKQKSDEVTRYQAELGTWKAGADQNYNKALQERELAERKTAAAIAKLKTIASASGLSEEEVLKDLDVTPKESDKPNFPNGFDPSKYLTREDVHKATSEAALLDAVIYDIGEQHKELFGGRLPDAKGLVQEAITSGKGIEQLWREKYKVADKVEELKTAKIRAELEKEFQERETSLRSQFNLPAPQVGREADPYSTHKIFNNPSLKKGIEGQNSEGISAAIAAYNSGKYSQNFKR